MSKPLVIIEYDPDTGYVKNKVTGTIYSTSRENVYIVFLLDGVTYFAHRVAYELGTGKKIPDGFEVDHINGIKTDNRLCNLRLATRSQNMMNRKCFKSNSLGEKGITFEKSKKLYRVRLTVEGKRFSLGRHSTLEKAVAARDAGLIKLHKEFACQNL